MATGTITSLGIGSSLDTQGILDGLREADEIAITKKENEITTLNASKDEFNVLNSLLLDMKSNASSLSLSSNFLTRSADVSSEILSVSSADGADIGSHTVQVDRLASKSSFTSAGKADGANSVYVPTVQKSSEGFATTDTDIVLAEDEKMTIVYGYGDDRKTITITGGAGGYSLDALTNAINTDAANDDGAGGTYVTAAVFADEGLNHLQVSATSNGAGEENRIMITTPPAATGFSADAAEFSYKLGEDEITLSVPADASLESLATLINDDPENPGVTASVVNTGYGDSPYQLVLTSDETGEDNRITITGALADLAMTEGNGAGFVMASDSRISFDTPVIIRQVDTNTDIVFQEDTGNGYSADITATIEDGVYTNGADLAGAVEKALEDASKTDGNSIDYMVSWNDGTGKLEIKEAGSLENLAVKWGDAGSTAGADLGFTSDQTLTPASASLNAFVTVDNISYQRQGNSGLTDLISGMSVSLTETGSANITVSQETEAVKENITAMISLFNDLATEINNNDDYDEETQTWGTLAKFSSVNTLESGLLSLFQTEVDTGGSITSLFDIGFEISSDGSISINETMLDDALANKFDAVQAFFTGDDSTTGMGDLLNDHLRDQTKLGGFIESETGAIGVKITSLEKTIESETERIDKKYETLTQQFVEMDSYMREMESMQSYVSQIFSATAKDKE